MSTKLNSLFLECQLMSESEFAASSCEIMDIEATREKTQAPRAIVKQETYDLTRLSSIDSFLELSFCFIMWYVKGLLMYLHMESA